jgi:hypothetical protein
LLHLIDVVASRRAPEGGFESFREDSCENPSNFGAVLINPGQFEAAMLWQRQQVVGVTASKVGFLNP